MPDDPKTPVAPPAEKRRPRAEEAPPLRPRDEIERQWAVRFGKAVCRTFTSNYHGLRVLTPVYPAHEPGGAILACNHTASIDPLLLQAALPSRTITWMMAREYSHYFGLQWLFRAIEPIMVDRSGRDMAATRAAIRALEHGRLIGLFPEGRIETRRELLEFQLGVAMLAVTADVPVYPAFIDGTQRGKGMVEAFFTPAEFTIAFGKPIRFDPKTRGAEGYKAATAQLRQAIEELSKLTP